MSRNPYLWDTSGNSAEDWCIFEILCEDVKVTSDNKLDPNCNNTVANIPEHHHGIDVVTALRSEMAAVSYKRDRLANDLGETRAVLAARESECENLRAQAARQSALISSLQNRLQTAESREQSMQTRCDSTIHTIQREKHSSDERNKELQCKIQHLENHLAAEEQQKEQARAQLNDSLRRLTTCLGVDLCENVHPTPECVLNRAEEVMIELQRTKAKASSTCDTLSSCENELMNLKSLANIEKQRLSAQLEGITNHNHGLEGRCRQYERDLQLQRDRLTESEISGEKLKEELRGFESRCHRLQNNLDRTQSERLQFLRCLANQLNVPEPCETLIKEKVRDMLGENQTMHVQLHSLRDQLNLEQSKLKETQETTQCRLRTEEAQKCELEERLEKCQAEIHTLRNDHLGLSEFLQRLARALNWAECTSPPALGTDTNILAESLLERSERIAAHYDHHGHEHDAGHRHHHHSRREHSPEKGCCDHHAHVHGKLRRERSCHDIPLKESSSIYTLQRRVRILREQVQRRDLHLELLRRKLAIIEEGARGKCMLQGERDEAVCRSKKASKQIDKLTAQLVDARSQIAEVKAQLAEAVEYKITALERARKIDELTGQICDLEEEKTRLLTQFNAVKDRLKATSESSQNRRCRDEALITSLREDITRLQNQLSDANHRLSHLQSFRTSVARTLHLRDLPESDLLLRLQALCSAHQEFTLLSKRYETTSPVGDHPCPRFDDPIPPTPHCRPPNDVELSGVPMYEEHARSSHKHSHHHSTAEHHQHKHRNKSRGGAGGGVGRCADRSNDRITGCPDGRNAGGTIATSSKRMHDKCFDSDVHRHHCSSGDFLSVGYDDLDFK
ncbi:coiled-coil domain-containing protein 170 [Zeugodacus cucurbitae]|uniref:coiled-coil domain-containing protein 170 n=1 Tax=Zeugodacus cucurbitae TaxID=28588 RepID=UPI0023D8F0E5|nr:coiled-coil domain-containing protein 170 [Zeugodacus cucurbitae]XP_054082974.1 coiled-coil domain-containing protein 170 [Zeugodacus cucurbitae]